MWVPRPELSLSRFASSEWVGLRVSFTRTGGAPEKAKVESTASGWVTLRVSSDERVRKRSHELEVSAADAVTLPLRKPDPRKIGGGGGNDSSSDEGASAAAASAAAASRVAILSPPRSMGVALASPRSEPQRRAAAPDVVGSDSASRACSRGRVCRAACAYRASTSLLPPRLPPRMPSPTPHTPPPPCDAPTLVGRSLL